jgi:hypothetical protein
VTGLFVEYWWAFFVAGVVLALYAFNNIFPRHHRRVEDALRGSTRRIAASWVAGFCFALGLWFMAVSLLT